MVAGTSLENPAKDLVSGTVIARSANTLPQQLDLTTLAAAPLIAPDAMATGETFTIGHRGTYKVENFNTFAAFVTALVADLKPTVTVADLAATGHYDSAANTFTANRIAVLIND